MYHHSFFLEGAGQRHQTLHAYTRGLWTRYNKKTTTKKKYRTETGITVGRGSHWFARPMRLVIGRLPSRVSHAVIILAMKRCVFLFHPFFRCCTLARYYIRVLFHEYVRLSTDTHVFFLILIVLLLSLLEWNEIFDSLVVGYRYLLWFKIRSDRLIFSYLFC